MVSELSMEALDEGLRGITKLVGVHPDELVNPVLRRLVERYAFLVLGEVGLGVTR
jgi:Tat protein secretion system quality control protein TatD with DNase activity